MSSGILKRWNGTSWEPVLVGEQGSPGQGLVQGGSTGDLLRKASNADYDTEWVDDKSLVSVFFLTHTQSSPSTTWTITHNLGAYPNVTTFESDGSEVEGEISHTNNNVVVVSFAIPVSGWAYLS